MEYNCVRIIIIEYMNWHHFIHVHGYIASNQVWVHGMVVHHSW